MKKVALDESRNATITAGHLKEPENIIFENGPMSNDDFTNEFHLLPCRIEYDGPAKVSQYFVIEELEGSCSRFL